MYTGEALNTLKNQSIEITVYGSPVIFKRSPFENRRGYLDPYELKALSLAEPHVGECFAGRSLYEMAELMRRSMGFPNINLNKEEIYTKYEELTFENNTVELWRYYKRRGKSGLRPAFIMIHGGGWVGGTVYVVENFCKLIAERADAIVFNIEYAKAPENPFPNAQNDCFMALEHIYCNAEKYGVDRSRIVIGGDSAGGNLALSTVINSRNKGKRYIRAIALMYPCTVWANASPVGYEWTYGAYDVSEEQKDIIANHLDLGKPHEFGTDPIELMAMENADDIFNPLYSPMLENNKEKMPDMLMISCEFDGLRQQDEYYAMQVRAAGNRVRCVRYGGITHAFIDRLGYIPQAEDAVNEVVDLIESTGDKNAYVF